MQTVNEVTDGNFTLRYKNGASVAEFNMDSYAYFGLTTHGDLFEADAATVSATAASSAAPEVLTNEQTQSKLVAYWNEHYASGANSYSFADVTHDGIDELFAVCGADSQRKGNSGSAAL